MAKPEHTAYQIQADFSKAEGADVSSRDMLGYTRGALDPNCIRSGGLKTADAWRRDKSKLISLTHAEAGYVSFGYDKAAKLLNRVREAAKSQWKKGERPTFFLRKLTMSEFMAHEQFKNYKDNSLVKSLYKKYLLLDRLSENGFQMS